jgi:signal transduction histidine kinase
MASSHRSATIPDSARTGVSVASLDELVLPADRAIVDAHIGLITGAPGAALLVWGSDAICLAHNRHYRSLAGLRVSILNKPLFRVQPELERPWRLKLELAFGGSGSTVDGSAFSGGAEGLGGDAQLGWMLPVAGPSGARGALIMFMDASALIEPTRRLVGALAQDLREPLVGVQVVAERLARLPKPTRERCVEDMDRVLEHGRVMDRLIDDMGAFSRRSSASGGARLSLRPGDLGAIVRLSCERIDSETALARRADDAKVPPLLKVNVLEAQGHWDDEAIYRVIATLVQSARQASDTGNVTVELSVASREGAILSVKDDGPGLRSDEAEMLFEPWRRGLAPAAERRRRGLGLGLYLARELVHAHGGRIVSERVPGGGFVVRVLLPLATVSAAPSSRSSFKTL